MYLCIFLLLLLSIYKIFFLLNCVIYACWGIAWQNFLESPLGGWVCSAGLAVGGFVLLGLPWVGLLCWAFTIFFFFLIFFRSGCSWEHPDLYVAPPLLKSMVALFKSSYIGLFKLGQTHLGKTKSWSRFSIYQCLFFQNDEFSTIENLQSFSFSKMADLYSGRV